VPPYNFLSPHIQALLVPNRPDFPISESEQPTLNKTTITSRHRPELNAVELRLKIEDYVSGQTRIHDFMIPAREVQSLVDNLWGQGFKPSQAPKPEDPSAIAERDERIERLEKLFEEVEAANAKLRDVVEVLMP